jgi:hypothetical protein
VDLLDQYFLLDLVHQSDLVLQSVPEVLQILERPVLLVGLLVQYLQLFLVRLVDQ